MLISVLHGHSNVAKGIKSSAIGGGSAKDSELHAFGSLARKKDNDDSLRSAEEDAPLLAEPSSSRHHVTADAFDDATAEAGNVRPRAEQRRVEDWRADVRILLICFSISGSLTLLTYFIPDLRNLPIFGNTAAITWLWTLNPSLAYVGQGIIMGPATTAHMLLGAVVGWGVLSPLAKFRGWAPGPVGDWEKGSKGWIVWVSLAVMLADAIISLANIAYREIRDPVAEAVKAFWRRLALSNRHLGKRRRRRRRVFSGDAEDDGDDGDRLLAEREGSFSRSSSTSSSSSSSSFNAAEDDELEDAAKASLLPAQRDAPASQQIGARTVTFGLLASIVFCIATIHIVFGNLVPLYATVASVAMALPLSVMGVRALGETDLNPVSGISKLTQLCFALIVPQSNRSSVLINLIAGAVVSSSWPMLDHDSRSRLTNSPQTVRGRRPPGWRHDAGPEDRPSSWCGAKGTVLGPGHRRYGRGRCERPYLRPVYVVRAWFSTLILHKLKLT